MIASNADLASCAESLLKKYTPAQIAQLVRLISPVPSCALMSPVEFERVIDVLAGQRRHRAFSARSLQAARLVLVMGASVAEAAAEVGLARQVVYRLMSRIEARMQALPGDWIKVDTWLPAVVAQQVTGLGQLLRSEREQGRDMGTFNLVLERVKTAR
ncbi:hypothetical protein IFR09_22920 [Pseudomonas syringae]|nr:hypothetical protein [Pseudomonas syringae]MBD8803200.1 hypothetical protein [Pseudomonas syringae]MBD8814020.1 hypothetical protein [Pseudomonas syringae]